MLTDGSLNSISRETLRKKKEKQSRYLIPPADVDLPDDSDLVHVEEDPGGVADQEGGDDRHQDEGEIVLLLPPPASSSLVDDEVNLVV